MGASVTFLQDVQDAYAKLMDLSMVLIDVDGNEITDISNNNPLSRLLHSEWGTTDHYKSFLEPLQSIRQPTVVDNRMGLKLIVSPIRVNDQICNYLIAGYFLEPLTRKLVGEYALQHYSNIRGLMEALELVRELSEEEKNKKLKLASTLTEVTETFINAQVEKKTERDTFAFIHGKLENIRTGKATASSFLEGLYHLHSDFNFIGLAIENNDSYYRIEAILGDHTEQFKGLTFAMGEGFLGHTIATQQFQFWKDTNNDPRINFFNRYGLYPKSLFCVPIFVEEKVAGILFGGSTKHEMKNPDILEPVKMHSSLLSVLITSENLRENLQNHLMELSTFNEVFRVMTTVKDIKRVLYILVDISINIMRGPFACIVFKSRKNDSKVDIVSRGLANTEINDYGYDVAKRAFSDLNKDMNLKQPVLGKTNWGNEVLEFPLSFNDHFFGMLCIGLTHKHDPEKYKAFLSTLAVAGSISIHLCQQEDGTGTDDSVIQLLQEAMSQQNEVQYKLSMKIKSHVKDFTSYLNDGDYLSLKKISGLVYFETTLLENYLSDDKLLSIFAEFKNVLAKKAGTSKDSEILAMIYCFVTQNENLIVIKEIPNIREELKEKFVDYVNQRSMVETEISLDFGRQPVTSSKPTIQNGESILKKKLNLSSREVEVLNQLLKGFNNREIASNLYISEHTVKNHITHIFQKLGVSDRSQAIAMIYQLGYSPSH
ncbi:LuxR C-terminal-related transcriptional regulator [Alkalihalobacillus deserti]|uniref:LuxR C-terminal-related transcriptional regulator n=1 Tax=Alkalihalobacillus deserti TaxID=2879466 RepID=UPI001D1361A0|nr:LuxR C-terminal-related transcriptional regulator [Alkalihalobacillus deserti]